MPDEDRLFERLHVADVDQSELEQLLLTHFSRSAGVSPREIHYLRGESNAVALLVRYDDEGELSAIEAGSALLSDDAARLEEKVARLLLKAVGDGIGQAVLFAYLPVTGHFRYGNRFQIVSMPDEAPRPSHLVGDHPLLLQFTVPESEDFQTTNLRRQRVAREIELLCVALTTSIWHSVGHVLQYRWVVRHGADPADWRSEFLQEGYMYTGAGGEATAFADLAQIAPIALTPHNEYYASVGISAGQVLDLPADFGGLLDRFYGASRDDRDRFLRASFWFQHAQRVANSSRSASFMALVSAIEALMPPTATSAACEACGKSLGPGATKRFTDFVSQFAPGPTVSTANRRKLYSLRSALTHGGSLLHSDRDGWTGSMTAKGLDEWDDRRAMWQIVRVALVNWLIARDSHA